MLRKQVERIEKRTGRMIAATTTAIQTDQEHATNTKCEHCGKKGLEFIEEYKPVLKNDKTIGADYRPKLICQKCKKQNNWG